MSSFGSAKVSGVSESSASSASSGGHPCGNCNLPDTLFLTISNFRSIGGTPAKDCIDDQTIPLPYNSEEGIWGNGLAEGTCTLAARVSCEPLPGWLDFNEGGAEEGGKTVDLCNLPESGTSCLQLGQVCCTVANNDDPPGIYCFDWTLSK